MQSRAAIRYAKAIFEIAKEENSIDSVFSDMKTVEILCNSSHDFKNLLSNSQINYNEKKTRSCVRFNFSMPSSHPSISR